MAPAVALGSASPMPAGPVIGQARKQSPHRVQASEIAAPRARNVSRKPSASIDPLIAVTSLTARRLFRAAIITQATAKNAPLCRDHRDFSSPLLRVAARSRRECMAALAILHAIDPCDKLLAFCHQRDTGRGQIGRTAPHG